MSNEEWVVVMQDFDCPEESIKAWSDDRRGEDTVRVNVILSGEQCLLRMLYFSLRDSGNRYRKMDSESSREMADNCLDMLERSIEVGLLNPMQ